MGNENCRSIQTLLHLEDTDPSERIERLMNLERLSLEEKLSALKRDANTESVQKEIDQYQKVLDTINYFKSNGGIIEAKERHEKVVQQGQSSLTEREQSKKHLQDQLGASQIYCKNQDNQLKDVRQQQQEANKLILSLTFKLEEDQKVYSKKKMQYEQELQFYQKDCIEQNKQFEKGKQQCNQAAQKQLGELKEQSKVKIDEFGQQASQLKSQFEDKQKELEGFQALKKQNEQENQKRIEEIKRNTTAQINKSLKEQENRLTSQSKQLLAQKQKEFEQQKQALERQIISLNQEQRDLEEQLRVKEILKAAELSNAKTEQDLKKQLEQLNPYQEVNQSEVEFLKQFQAVQVEKPTVEQVKIIATKHQQVQQDLVKQLKENLVKPQSTVSQDKKKQIEGYRGVLLVHAMLEEQGITSYITDKPISQIEQSSKGVYQQKIIQCGIQDSSSYYTANYASSQYMEKQILQANNLQNYIQNFKNEMAKKIDDKDVTPQNIQVFGVTTSPACINFQINSNSGRKVNFKSKDFSSLGINIETQNLLDKAELSIDMFEPKYNMSWDNMSSKTDQRGALKFKNNPQYTPQIYNFPIGYYGLGLKVLERYGKDQRWIRADTQPDTWIMLFHGTGYQNLKGIIAANKINPGYNNEKGDCRCRITGTIIKGGHNVNTYLADNVKDTEYYSLRLPQLDNIPYCLAFQCRVNPNKVKSPEDRPNYYTVENPLDDIRPYRLLIKKKIN